VSGSGAVSGCEKNWLERERSGRSRSGERSGERTKLAAQISLKGDASPSLIKLRKSILPHVKNKLSTGIPRRNFRASGSVTLASGALQIGLLLLLLF